MRRRDESCVMAERPQQFVLRLCRRVVPIKRMRDNKPSVWPSDVRMKGTSKVREKGVA